MQKHSLPWLALMLIVSVGVVNVAAASATAGPTLTVSPFYGYPVDPVCHANRISEPGTRITVKGKGWTAGQVVTVTTDYPSLTTVGTPTASSTGTWTVHFTVPTAPDHAYVNVAGSDPKGESARFFYWLMPYTCFHSANRQTWQWDAVGWDANSPLTMKFDQVQVAKGTAGANGALATVSFPYNCPAGTSHKWLVTGRITGIPGGPTGTASGTFSC